MTDIRTRLQHSSRFVFSIYAIAAAFSTYACMYAFRKPFTAATFSGLSLWSIDYKVVLVISQVAGYALAKFLGIKVVSEMPAGKRARTILMLIGFAELSLLFFGLLPHPYNAFFLFLNGLSLGMIWGLVFSYLEGRTNTELLGAGLSVSFIVSSGFVKTIGSIVMNDWGVSEFMMPFVTGALFTIPLIISVYFLNKIPSPSKEDEAQRTKRVPMYAADRKQFFRKFAGGIIALTLIYMLLTAFRDIRDSFAADIWQSLSAAGRLDEGLDLDLIFTYTELPVGFGVLIIIGLLVLIKNNLKALLINHALIIAGLLLIGISMYLFEQQIISAPVWMVLNGLGAYLGYVPFNCVLFDRLIAAFKTAANAGFLIYIADSFGYAASIGIMLYKNFGETNLNWYEFIAGLSYLAAGAGILFSIISIVYFVFKSRRESTTPQA